MSLEDDLDTVERAKDILRPHMLGSVNPSSQRVYSDLAYARGEAGLLAADYAVYIGLDQAAIMARRNGSSVDRFWRAIAQEIVWSIDRRPKVGPA